MELHLEVDERLSVREAHDLVDAFATRFDDLPEAVPGRSDYRWLIAAGALVRGVSVIGQLTSDESIELLHIKLDLDTPWDEWD